MVRTRLADSWPLRAASPRSVPGTFANIFQMHRGEPRQNRSGDLTDSPAIAWRHSKGTSYVPSPLLYHDKLYCFSGNELFLRGHEHLYCLAAD